MSKKYEVVQLDSEGNVICRGGIPTNKAHAQRWANLNQAMYPDEHYGVAEYMAPGI